MQENKIVQFISKHCVHYGLAMSADSLRIPLFGVDKNIFKYEFQFMPGSLYPSRPTIDNL